MKKVKNLDEIVINTDSEEAIDVAKNFKISYKKRDPYFASSECSNSEFWQNVAENTDSEYIIFTHCTNPMIKVITYEDTIKKFQDFKEKHDSLNTVTEIKEFLYLKNRPINFDPSKSPNSQNLPDVIKLNFAINIPLQN